MSSDQFRASILALLVVTLLVTAWFKQYRYVEMDQGFVRIHRVTGETDVFFGTDWLSRMPENNGGQDDSTASVHQAESSAEAQRPSFLERAGRELEAAKVDSVD